MKLSARVVFGESYLDQPDEFDDATARGWLVGFLHCLLGYIPNSLPCRGQGNRLFWHSPCPLLELPLSLTNEDPNLDSIFLTMSKPYASPFFPSTRFAGLGDISVLVIVPNRCLCVATMLAVVRRRFQLKPAIRNTFDCIGPWALGKLGKKIKNVDFFFWPSAFHSLLSEQCDPEYMARQHTLISIQQPTRNYQQGL